MNRPTLQSLALGSAALVALTGCDFSAYAIPFPGGADLGDHPYSVTIHFRDVLDLVPQSGVRVNDIAVGKVTGIKLNGWTAVVKVKINADAKLPDNAVASIRQTSLLGEKFVSLAAPPSGATGRLGDGDVIGLDRSGRNPEIEEVLGAASLLFNGGGLEKTRTVVRELNNTMEGNEPQIRELLTTANRFVSQLDDNKDKILTALEKVNNLAVQTNRQKDAITGALDQLPEALTVVNQQRDDLLKLLQALNRLGDVGTRVVVESKADTLADLKSLLPALTQLANAGDDLATSLTALFTFPFPDGAVGGSTVQGAKDFQQGDYFNLSAQLDLSLQQLADLTGMKLNGLGTSVPTSSPPAAAPQLGALADLVEGLVPEPDSGPQLPGGLSGEGTAEPTPSSPPASGGSLQVPRMCSLLGSCRVAPGATDATAISPLARLLLEPLVAS